MCNIAGYVGSKQAAPILIDMLRKQEGLDAGYYAGIATIHEGKIYYRKLVGSLERLVKETDAAALPGTIGIIHGRTPGDTGDSWAHPFTCEKDGEVKTAFVLNGLAGCGKKFSDRWVPLAEDVLADGYELKSRVESNGKNLTLSDNTRVHMSDVMTQLISRRILNGMNTVDAIEESFCEFPKEIVGLLLSTTEPNGISWGRMNFPMHLGFADDGAYLATAPLCFPEKVGEPILLPLMSTGVIYSDRFTCKKFKNPPFTVAPFSAKVRAEAYEGICKLISQEAVNINPLGKLCEELFEEADCTQRGAAIYSVLYELHKQGRLNIETKYKPGVYEGLEAPVFYMSLIDKGEN